MSTVTQRMKQSPPRATHGQASAQSKLRLLIPVDATERSRWGIAYALALQKGGTGIEVDLLFVAEPITAWQVLRFRTQTEIAAFQRQYGQWQLEDAVSPLQYAGIVTRTHFREGKIAFEILDIAEQLGSDRIVLPEPYPRWMNLLNGDFVRDVLKRSTATPIVTVDRNGLAQLAEAVPANAR